MEEKSVKTIPLANDLTLELFDLSRKISRDAFQVIMVARVAIPVEAALFSPETLDRIPLKELHRKLGPTATFEHRKERNFIMEPDKETVFDHLVKSFTETLLPYISKPVFPEKYILKCYND